MQYMGNFLLIPSNLFLLTRQCIKILLLIIFQLFEQRLYKRKKKYTWTYFIYKLYILYIIYI